MRAPGGGLTGDVSSGAVAWLRFVEERGGQGVRAALLQTSGGGEPLGFSFTRIDRDDSAIRRPVRARCAAMETLAATLMRAASPAPALVLGLASEVPIEALAGGLPVELPFCLFRPAGARADATACSVEALWATAEPHGESTARRLFDEIVERDDPLEPLERAAEALAVAFADDRVQALATVSGLATTVSLAPRPKEIGGWTGRPATGEAVGAGAEPRGHLLAARLWAALAAPAVSSRRGRNAQLSWAAELMPFQQEGVQALLDSDRLLLADDMGLGKTVQTIAALRILHAQGAISSCLVAAPASVLDQWRREIDKWAPELSAIIIRGPVSDRAWQWAARVDVTLVSYDTLRADFGGRAPAAVRTKRWDVVVADEAQRIKNRNDTSDTLKKLRRTRSWALTGTPIENHEEELASILEFVDHDDPGAPKRYRPGVELLARHRELQLRRKKIDVLDDLPPKQVRKVPIALNPRQRNSYDKAERDGIVYLKSLGAEVSVRHVLELITRLKQICNADPQTGESSKLEDIRDRLVQLTAQGHRALVFSQYTNDVSGVAAAAGYLREFNPLTLTGATRQEDRTAILDLFKTDDAHKVLVLSLRAGGLGLNLQQASYVFHLDRWWNPAVERQAEDRSYRIGQTVKVNVIAYSCTGTIEERIDAILEHKQRLFDELVDDVSLDLSARMNRDELLGLFGLQGGRASRDGAGSLTTDPGRRTPKNA